MCLLCRGVYLCFCLCLCLCLCLCMYVFAVHSMWNEQFKQGKEQHNKFNESGFLYCCSCHHVTSQRLSVWRCITPVYITCICCTHQCIARSSMFEKSGWVRSMSPIRRPNMTLRRLRNFDPHAFAHAEFNIVLLLLPSWVVESTELFGCLQLCTRVRIKVCDWECNFWNSSLCRSLKTTLLDTAKQQCLICIKNHCFLLDESFIRDSCLTQ